MMNPPLSPPGRGIKGVGHSAFFNPVFESKDSTMKRVFSESFYDFSYPSW